MVSQFTFEGRVGLGPLLIWRVCFSKFVNFIPNSLLKDVASYISYIKEVFSQIYKAVIVAVW